MNFIPIPVKGSVLDLPIERNIQLLYVTNRPGGGPIKQRRPEPVAPEKPKDLGEERHIQLLSAIKGLNINVNQKVQQAVVTESLSQQRDWRG